ncbi:MAG: ribosome silencing factor [Solirubrobacterales bacterium]
MDSEALAKRIATVADEKGATDIVAIDVSELLGYTDYLIICTARNERQAKAVAEEVQLRLKREDELIAKRVEGLPEARWILVDYIDCILHVFIEETRDLYRLEQLWGEAPRLDVGVSADDVRSRA